MSIEKRFIPADELRASGANEDFIEYYLKHGYDKTDWNNIEYISWDWEYQWWSQWFPQTMKLSIGVWVGDEYREYTNGRWTYYSEFVWWWRKKYDEIGNQILYKDDDTRITWKYDNKNRITLCETEYNWTKWVYNDEERSVYKERDNRKWEKKWYDQHHNVIKKEKGKVGRDNCISSCADKNCCLIMDIIDGIKEGFKSWIKYFSKMWGE